MRLGDEGMSYGRRSMRLGGYNAQGLRLLTKLRQSSLCALLSFGVKLEKSHELPEVSVRHIHGGRE